MRNDPKRSIERESYDEDMKLKLHGKIQNANGCWEWKGFRLKTGYGKFSYKRKSYLAHRISWYLFNGPIPDYLCVCHKCDNPPCINPEHLFLGTQVDNIQDMIKKNRRDFKGENAPYRKLSSNQVLKIRELIQNGVKQKEICRIFDITQGHVASIKYRRCWKELI